MVKEQMIGLDGRYHYQVMVQELQSVHGEMMIMVQILDMYVCLSGMIYHGHN